MSSYTNPIILSDYSDPDVIRVGNYYYMTASSFHVTPGLPLLQSSDLIHWNLVGYAAPTIPLSAYDTPQHSKGVWAPSLRYHNLRFIIVVGFPDEGIFVTEAESFTGQWSPLRCIYKAKGFIDPCPFWDDNGNAYIVHGYAKSRIGFNSRLGVLKADPETLDCIGEDTFIFYGEQTQPTIEGPKVYKRNDWYYIFAPAGGVKQGWQTVLRSRSILGPYEQKIVMQQGIGHINGPHQGGLVDTPCHIWWFLHFQDRGIYGRVTLLEPVTWTDDDWVVMGQGVQTGQCPADAVDSYECPPCIKGAQGTVPGYSATVTDDLFVKDTIGLQWQWQANAKKTFIEKTRKRDKTKLLKWPRLEYGLHLAALRDTEDGEYQSLWDCAHVLTQKLVYEAFVSDCVIDVQTLQCGSRTGVLFLGSQYASVGIEHTTNNSWQLYYLESHTDEKNPEQRIDTVKEIYVIPPTLSQQILGVATPLRMSITWTPCPIDMQAAKDGTVDMLKPSQGQAVFTITCGDFSWTPHAKAFSAPGDHWVAGRIGFYAQSCADTLGKESSVACIKEYRVTQTLS